MVLTPAGLVGSSQQQDRIKRYNFNLFCIWHQDLDFGRCLLGAGPYATVGPDGVLIDCKQSRFFFLSLSSRGKTSRTPARGVCGHHDEPLRHHCPRVECYHFVSWMRHQCGLPHNWNMCNTLCWQRFSS